VAVWYEAASPDGPGCCSLLARLLLTACQPVCLLAACLLACLSACLPGDTRARLHRHGHTAGASQPLKRPLLDWGGRAWLVMEARAGALGLKCQAGDMGWRPEPWPRTKRQGHNVREEARAGLPRQQRPAARALASAAPALS